MSYSNDKIVAIPNVRVVAYLKLIVYLVVIKNILNVYKVIRYLRTID